MHNIDEKPSPDPNLCLHCYFLKLNEDLEKLSWKERILVPKDENEEQKKKDGKSYICKSVEKTCYIEKSVPCPCGCDDICPECEGEGYAEYTSGGPDTFLDGCLICNNGGDPYEPTEDRIEDW